MIWSSFSVISPILFLHHLPQAHGLLVCGMYTVHSSIKTLVPMFFLGTLFRERLSKAPRNKDPLDCFMQRTPLHTHNPWGSETSSHLLKVTKLIDCEYLLGSMIFDSRVCSFPWQGTYQCQCITVSNYMERRKEFHWSARNSKTNQLSNHWGLCYQKWMNTDHTHASIVSLLSAGSDLWIPPTTDPVLCLRSIDGWICRSRMWVKRDKYRTAECMDFDNCGNPRTNLRDDCTTYRFVLTFTRHSFKYLHTWIHSILIKTRQLLLF